jgi:hypothetical protein
MCVREGPGVADPNNCLPQLGPAWQPCIDSFCPPTPHPATTSLRHVLGPCNSPMPCTSNAPMG